MCNVDLAGLSGVSSNPRQILSLCIDTTAAVGSARVCAQRPLHVVQEHQAALYVDQQSSGYYGEAAAVMDGDQFQPAAPVRHSAGKRLPHRRNSDLKAVHFSHGSVDQHTWQDKKRCQRIIARGHGSEIVHTLSEIRQTNGRDAGDASRGTGRQLRLLRWPAQVVQQVQTGVQ